jgi:phage FluMu protein Com
MKNFINEHYGDLEKRCGKCNKLLFTVSNFMFWTQKLEINIKCPRCGEMNHVIHHDFNKNTEKESAENV